MYLAGVEAFLAIVRTGSLTRAAELLHLSQSSVSYRLKVLEREMGAVLVERAKGIQTVKLTPHGESFVALAERWSLLKRETEMLRAAGPRVSLAIGAADSLNIYVLPPLYRALCRQCPSVRLAIRTQHTMESYEAVERREADAAFVKMERVAPNVVVEPFYVDEMVLVRLAAEGRAEDDGVAPGELDSRHQLFFDWGPSYQLWHDRWWDAQPPARLQVDAAALVFSLMWDRRQWAVMPRSIARALARPGEFAVQRFSEPPPPRVSYKLTHRHRDAAKEAALEAVDGLARLIYAGSRGQSGA